MLTCEGTRWHNEAWLLKQANLLETTTVAQATKLERSHMQNAALCCKPAGVDSVVFIMLQVSGWSLCSVNTINTIIPTLELYSLKHRFLPSIYQIICDGKIVSGNDKIQAKSCRFLNLFKHMSTFFWVTKSSNNRTLVSRMPVGQLTTQAILLIQYLHEHKNLCRTVSFTQSHQPR